MNKTKVRRAFEAIASYDGITVEEVRAEITKLIIVGINSSDPGIREKWYGMSANGGVPTPEEVVAHMSKLAALYSRFCNTI